MKRHERLISISREHHTVLSLANRILKNPQADHLPEITAKRPMLLAHFDEEESEFAALWQGLSDQSLQQQFDDEHCQLRELIATADNPAVWEKLARTLHDHVRFEERELFPAFEQYILDVKENS